MSTGTPGILSSLLEDEDLIAAPAIGEEIVQTENLKVKNPKNKKAASNARAAGAKTGTERALEGALADQAQLTNKAQQVAKVQKSTENVNTLLDKIGAMPKDQRNSDQTYQRVKQMVPGLTRESYGSLSASAERRAFLTRQLAQLPVGTPLPPETKKQLAQAGITEPNKYMSLSVTLPGTNPIGAFQQAAAARVRAGKDAGVFTGVGADIVAKEAAIGKATESFFEQEATERKQMIQAITSETKGLTENQRISQTRSLANDVKKDFKTGKTLFEWFNLIQDFSDPETSKSTVRFRSGGQIKAGDAIVLKGKEVGNRSFQNVRDIGLLYGLIKMLDPDSVVREGEIALSEKASGLAQRMKIFFDKAYAGEILEETTRAGIIDTANQRLINSAKLMKDNVDLYNKQIESFGFKRDLIVPPSVDKFISAGQEVEKALIKAAEGVDNGAEKGQFDSEEEARAGGAFVQGLGGVKAQKAGGGSNAAMEFLKRKRGQ